MSPISPPLPDSSPPRITSPSKSKQPSNTELDVFSSLTELKPGTIPLIVRMPDGNQSQITLPLHSTVEDLAANLQKDLGASPDDLRFSFANVDLNPGTTLLESNIVDAYEHAGSLLNVIGQGGLDAQGKAVALETACTVVQNVSNGIKDMEALCAAAVENASAQNDFVSPQSPRMATLVAQGQAEAERETPKQIDAGEFKMLNHILATPPDKHAAQDTPQHQPATPSELVYSLSRRMPHIFPPSALAANQHNNPSSPTTTTTTTNNNNINSPSNENGNPTQSHQHEMDQPSLGRRMNSVAQPSLSMIRDARRRARQAAADNSTNHAEPTVQNSIRIGESTNGIQASPERDGSRETASAAAVMAASAKSTWMEDLMKTWQVGVVRESGVLEKSKDGQELNDYLHGLEKEAQKEVEIAQIEEEQHEEQDDAEKTVRPAEELPGDSEDEEDDDVDVDGDEILDESVADPSEQSAHHDEESSKRGTATENGLQSLGQQNVPNFAIASGGHGKEDAATQMIKAQSSAAAMLNCTKSPQSSQYTLATQSPTTTFSTSSAQRIDSPTRSEGSPSQSGCKGMTPKLRQATKIAPAPPAHAALSPGIPGVAAANGMYPNTMFPAGVGPSGVVLPNRPPAPARKRRGRKRKNPELTEEERALFRKKQNRESAKLSRVRRKVIAAEYEGRLNALIGENTMLRKQVEGLNNRLVYLQSLLTISVRQEPTSEQRLQTVKNRHPV